MYLRKQDRIEVQSNVIIRLCDDDGAVVDQRESHNIFVNNGRKWLRNHLARAIYPASHAAGTNGSAAGDGSADVNSPVVYGGIHKSFWPRYVGVGVGGVGQTITPPGPGTYIEQASADRLERPVQVANPGTAQWLKQVLEQNDFTNDEIFPDDFSIRFRAVFGKDDISFVAQPTYATAVPISEVALFTSEAGRDVVPSGGSYANAKVGFIAYNTFSPITKTPKFVLELDWELRL